MKRDRRLTFWNIWLGWISANAMVWVIGFGLAQTYARLLYPGDSYLRQVLEGARYIWTRPLDSPVATANYGLMLGAVIGLGQWLVLRRRLDIKWQWWLAATALGFTVHGLFMGLDVNYVSGGGSALSGDSGQGIALASLGILCGGVFLVGVPQWLVLRPHLPRAGWWLPASAAGLLLASPDRSGGTNSLVGWLVISMGAGAVFGIVTAFVLFYLMPAPSPSAVDLEGS
jgi:hypothetical protein